MDLPQGKEILCWKISLMLMGGHAAVSKRTELNRLKAGRRNGTNKMWTVVLENRMVFPWLLKGNQTKILYEVC